LSVVAPAEVTTVSGASVTTRAVKVHAPHEVEHGFLFPADRELGRSAEPASVVEPDERAPLFTSRSISVLLELILLD